MPQDNNGPALAINLSETTILLPAQDLATILKEVQDLRSEFERFKKTHSAFAVRTTNELDELFAKVSQIREDRKPGKLTERRLKKLDYMLTSRSNEAMTFAEIGKILELGSRSTNGRTTRAQAMTKLGKIIVNKGSLYEVSESKTQKGAKLVKLTRDYYRHCQEEFFGV